MDGPEDLHPALRGLSTVCRCNNIKYRTILGAIHEGAWALHQVAMRTKATTGHCGGSCTPDVQRILAEHAPKHVTQPPRPAPRADPNAWWVREK
ncbi:MAG: (2Fe-2S)-binding protein [Thermoanaerobaculia bacterium]